MGNSGNYYIITMSDTTYPTLLLVENKIQLLDPFSGAKKHHSMQCLVCNHVWTATPLSKRQTFKKYGVGGCPKCNLTKRTQSHKETRDDNLASLSLRFEFLDGYDGRRKYNNDTTVKIHVRNKQCGHDFWVTPTNLLTRGVDCPTCGEARRVEGMYERAAKKSAAWRTTCGPWKEYKRDVGNATNQTYTIHKDKINPSKLPRGVAGVDGAYHLDHIVSIKYCFDHNVPVEVCAHYSNLQMLPWKDNLGAKAKLKGDIPEILKPYIL